MQAIKRDQPLTMPPWSHYIYDIETYPNIFSLGAIHHETGTRYCFEISDRVNQAEALWHWLEWLRNNRCRMVGFNNEHFDYPVIHAFMRGAHTSRLLYQKAQSIIDSFDRFAHIIWPGDRFVPQVDLFKIHHFDNKARSTSLKALEFAMRMQSIEDLPFPVGIDLTPEQMQKLIDYMHHDVDATWDFFKHSHEALAFRDQLTEKYKYDFTNANDTKIGKQYFIMKLEAAGVACYDRSNGRKCPRQTHRPNGIPLGEIIFPFIGFSDPQLRRVHDWLRNHTVRDTREKLLYSPKIDNKTPAIPVHAVVNGFRFDFGLGGLHGSVESQLVESTPDTAIIDVDVTSYYPSIPIAQRIYPEHLGEAWCDITVELKEMRLKHAKGTVENAAGKLAMNGSYGDTNSEYSPFFDPRYTMAITVNGQLMLAMLSEWAMTVPGLSMVQANTDGITVKLPRAQIETFNGLCAAWEKMTGMELEAVYYSRMWVRDCNNYVAEYA